MRGRDAALSRAQIVAAAIDLLDRDGETRLTFKALAEQLATGAIYHHIVGKRDLMAAADDAVVAEMQRTLVTMAATANAVLARWTAVRFSIG